MAWCATHVLCAPTRFGADPHHGTLCGPASTVVATALIGMLNVRSPWCCGRSDGAPRSSPSCAGDGRAPAGGRATTESKTRGCGSTSCGEGPRPCRGPAPTRLRAVAAGWPG
eukprot:scaffold22199_cov118-Isochrysis_galbana.AAC.3